MTKENSHTIISIIVKIGAVGSQEKSKKSSFWIELRTVKSL